MFRCSTTTTTKHYFTATTMERSFKETVR